MKSVVKKINNKILVAMSGGVDSSVAAALLVKAGYDVTGAFMVNYDDARDPLPTSPLPTGQAGLKGGVGDNLSPSAREGARGSGSCWHGDYQDALRVAAKLKIPLLRLDFVKEYQKMVLDYTFKSYSAGRTPNPDILCNKFVKFGAWLERAKKLGFNKLATGHYARIAVSPCPRGRKRGGGSVRHKLMSAKDANKDQTYFLHQLNQKQLSQTLFPLGNYTKPEVRALAKKFNLPTAEKAESMGICFVGEMPMREFLKDKVKAKPGKIITTGGEIVGEHDGLPFYTIGERVGNLSFRAIRSTRKRVSGESRNPLSPNTPPLFVVDKNTKTNTLIVGLNNDPALFKKEIIVSGVNWVAGQEPKLPLKCKVRLRHRQELQDATVIPTCLSGRQATKEGSLSRSQACTDSSRSAKASVRNDNYIIKFTQPQRAVTPGQFAVMYKNGECLGGGEII